MLTAFHLTGQYFAAVSGSTHVLYAYSFDSFTGKEPLLCHMLRESKILRKAWTASVSSDLFVYFLAISITCNQSLRIIVRLLLRRHLCFGDGRTLELRWGARGLVRRGEEKYSYCSSSLPMTPHAPQPNPNLLSTQNIACSAGGFLGRANVFARESAMLKLSEEKRNISTLPNLPLS